MKYLLDSNAFIEAKNEYYKFSFCPAYWHWVNLKHQEEIVYSIDNVRAELLYGNDELTDWAKDAPENFFLKPMPQLAASLAVIAQWVVDQKYTEGAKNTFLSSADYYLIAYAHVLDYTVVTREKSDLKSKRRVKIPDVCNHFNVPYINPFVLLEKEAAQFVCEN